MQLIVKEIVEVVGLGDAIAIVRAWGGRVVYVPTSVQDGDAFVLALGLSTARKMVAAFGGQRLRLPAERNVLIDLRNASIIRDAEAGQSHPVVSVKYGVTRQHVSHIVKKAREARQAFAPTVDAVPA